MDFNDDENNKGDKKESDELNFKRKFVKPFRDNIAKKYYKTWAAENSEVMGDEYSEVHEISYAHCLIAVFLILFAGAGVGMLVLAPPLDEQEVAQEGFKHGIAPPFVEDDAMNVGKSNTQHRPETQWTNVIVDPWNDMMANTFLGTLSESAIEKIIITPNPTNIEPTNNNPTPLTLEEIKKIAIEVIPSQLNTIPTGTYVKTTGKVFYVGDKGVKIGIPPYESEPCEIFVDTPSSNNPDLKTMQQVNAWGKYTGVQSHADQLDGYPVPMDTLEDGIVENIP